MQAEELSDVNAEGDDWEAVGGGMTHLLCRTTIEGDVPNERNGMNATAYSPLWLPARNRLSSLFARRASIGAKCWLAPGLPTSTLERSEQASSSPAWSRRSVQQRPAGASGTE